MLDILYVRPCVMCGKPVRVSDEMNLCAGCRRRVPRFGMTVNTPGSLTVAVLPYSGYTRRAMFKFKFRGKKYYGFTFGKLIYNRLREMPWNKNIDCVICVPMMKGKRPYNQSAVIAECVANHLGLPFEGDALVKTKDNPPFYKLKYKERLRLVKGAYDIGGSACFAGKNVLLIDDIYTTGSTLNECRRVLLMNGAKEVFCAAACYVAGNNYKL